MKYTRGKAGPVSRMLIEVGNVHHFDKDAPNGRSRGDGIATMKSGIKAVSFLAQGKHHKALLAEDIAVGKTIDVTVRWTARDEVTVTEVHRELARAARFASCTALDPERMPETVQ